MNWPLYIALILVLMKQLMKLFVNHKPDGVDYLKALATVPTDVSFLVVGLFIRQFAKPTLELSELVFFLLAYLTICGITTVLWRISESAINDRIHLRFAFCFPFNVALSGLTFYWSLIVLK